jgi:hypothetical protein
MIEEVCSIWRLAVCTLSNAFAKGQWPHVGLAHGQMHALPQHV